jgi:hypothetical protein
MISLDAEEISLIIPAGQVMAMSLSPVRNPICHINT